MTKISFQGERGAYSEMAALNYFTKIQNDNESSIEFLTCMTFSDVLNSTEDAKSEYSILPIENSIHCLLYTSPSPRDGLLSRMPSSA